MARQKDFEVKLQIKVEEEWASQEEYDIPESLEDGASTLNRWVIGVNARAAPFRFLIKVSNSFQWESTNILKVVLTFDEGRTVDRYPIFLSKVNLPWAEKGTIRKMQQTADGYEYYLDSVALPLVRYELQERWCLHTFEFYHMKAKSPSTGSEEQEPVQQKHHRHHRHQRGRLRLVLEAVSMTACKHPRLIGIQFQENLDWTVSRRRAIEQGMTLETAIKVQSPCARVVQHRENKTRHPPVTFVFLYREDQQEKSLLTDSSVDAVEVRPIAWQTRALSQKGGSNLASRQLSHSSSISPRDLTQKSMRTASASPNESEAVDTDHVSCDGTSYLGIETTSVSKTRSRVPTRLNSLCSQSEIEKLLQDVNDFQAIVREEELRHLEYVQSEEARIDAEIASADADRCDAEADVDIVNERLQEVENRRVTLEEEKEVYQKRSLESQKRTTELRQHRAQLRAQQPSLGGEAVRSALQDVETKAIKSWRLQVQELQDQYNRSRKRKLDALTPSPNSPTR